MGQNPKIFDFFFWVLNGFLYGWGTFWDHFEVFLGSFGTFFEAGEAGGAGGVGGVIRSPKIELQLRQENYSSKIPPRRPQER